MAESSLNARPHDIGKEVPLWRPERGACREAAHRYAGARELVPPLSLDELEEHAARILEAENFPPAWHGFVMVLLNNEIWSAVFAALPYERRLLLLPQCLRSAGECPAEHDEMGLLCRECGRCPVGELQALAEKLGYLVLVAEGATLVVRLLESGTVDAVVGVSCLSALERSFPQTVANAIPSLAVPLYVDGCADTKADIDWVREIIVSKDEMAGRKRLDPGTLQCRVQEWFNPESLAPVLGEFETNTERLASNWIAKAGKRWRPLLVAAVYEALAGSPVDTLDTVRLLAIAVECFHKASLVHDDIEDGDALRYGAPALHSAQGIPAAINAGDLLIGEGYRLIATSEFPAETRAVLTTLAAQAHRVLCIGQGEEIDAARRGVPPSTAAMLDIFRMKTSPSFGVALKFGAVAAGAGETLCAALDVFSDALGIAYQIRDDIADRRDEGRDGADHPRLSLFSSLAEEMGAPLQSEAVLRKAEMLLEHYRQEAVRSLTAFRNAELKGLLRRLLERLLASS